MKQLITLLLFAVSAFGQTARFVAPTGAVALVATGTTATLQQPATGAEQITLESVEARCPAACVITQKQNSVAATATDSSTLIKGLMPYQGSVFTLLFYTASNVSGGTTTNTTTCDSACTVVFDLSQVRFGTGGTSFNYSVSISAVTGDAYITFYGKRQ